LIEARFDGGLYAAVRDQAPRCRDGITACSVETEAEDCAAMEDTRCAPISAYSEGPVLPGFPRLLSTQLYGAAEVVAIDAAVNDQSVLSILLQDQNGIEGNNAVARVPELNILLALLGTTPASSITLLGKFVDDDGPAAAAASFLAMSLGFDGPVVDGMATWLDKNDVLPTAALVDNGPAPESFENIRDIGVWGTEVEPTDLEGGVAPLFYRGATNFLDWYYPSSGLSVTAGLGLDTTALSAPPPVGRGRSDIDNRTQATKVDLPVIAFGGSNGLARVPAVWLGYADSLAVCAAPSCDGTTLRVLNRSSPSEAFPTFGHVAGGFEVYISEGYTHADIATADDDETNNVIGPLLDFINRNMR